MAQLYKNVVVKNVNKLQMLKSKHDVKQTYTFKDEDFQKLTINSLTLYNGQFHGCDFTVSNIGGCVFNKCEFVKCKFNYTTLLGVKFDECIINQCDFTQAKMEDVVFLNNIISSNKFENVQVKNNVTINGQNILDGKQLDLLVNDKNSNIITDEINDKSELIIDVLNQIKSLTKSEQKSYELIEGNICLCICEDQGGWRIMFGYMKDDQFDDSIVSNLIDTDNKITKTEILNEIYESINNLGKSAKEKIKTDMIKKYIDEILKKINASKPTIQESVNTLQERFNVLLEENNQLKQYIKQLLTKIKE